MLLHIRLFFESASNRLLTGFKKSIRVNVDSNNLTLQVARRADKDTGWSYLRDPIMLPADVLNVSTRTVPKDFVLLNLPECLTDYTPNKPERGRQGRKPSSMEVSSQNE